MTRRCSKIWTMLVALAGLGVASSPAWGQRVTFSEPNRQFMHVDNPIGYRSYSLDRFELKPSHTLLLPRYDRMGNFLMMGELVYAVDETRPGIASFGGMVPSRFAGKVKMNYAVQRDSYRGVAYTLMVLPANPGLVARQMAETVRTRFSPLTLNVTRFSGVRFDASGRRNRTTLIYSRGASNRLRFSVFTPGIHERSPVILWGGHWQSQLGTALRIGTTFVNQHITDTTVKRGSIFRGNLPYEMLPPTTITVRVTDDSPDDASSAAAVYSVSIILEGTNEEGVARRITNDVKLAVGGIELEPGIAVSPSGRRAGDHYEAVGADQRIEYTFTLPPGYVANRAEFVAEMAGDYRVGVRQTHDFIEGGTTKKSEWPAPSSALGGRYEQGFLPNPNFDPRYPIDFKFPEKDPVYTVVRASGNERDLTQRKTVRFVYGMPTAQSLISTDFSLDYRGYTLDGEIALNVQDFMFPAARARRSDEIHRAYFLKGSGPLPRLATRIRPHVGVEVFDIPAVWSGGYDAKRGGSIFFTDVAPFPKGPVTQEFNLYDDNDDGDQWPDDNPDDSAVSNVDDAGVFPGLDENQDHVIDTDQNSNGRPDWQEPFLFYGADPPEFVHDVDFNNNGVPDMTENDDEADYPYRRGHRGFHTFLEFPELLSQVDRLALGFYGTKDRKGDGESRARYIRLDAHVVMPSLGRVEITDILKWVKDDIPDPTYIWDVTDDPRDNLLVVQSTERASLGRLLDLVPPDPDLQLMRNSTVNTIFLRTDLEPYPGVEVRGRDQLVLNRQHDDTLGDGTEQKAGTALRWALSHRVGYTRTFGEGGVVIRVRGKHLFRWDRGFGEDPQRRYTIVGPIADVTYMLSKQTRLMIGQDGWPLLPFRLIDHENDDDGFRQRTTLAMVRSEWMYWGWDLVVEIGMQWQTRQTNAGERGQRTFFLESFVGF